MNERGAIEQAIYLLRMPASARLMRPRPLPPDIGLLLQILAGDEEAERSVSATFQRPIETVREAAEFYAGEILFAPGLGAYRALAAEPGAPREELRANFATLTRWLHPDHGQDSAHTAWFERVVNAWDILGPPASRAQYDRQLKAQISARPATPAAPTAPGRAPFFATSGGGPRPKARRALRPRRPWIKYAAGIAAVAGLVWIVVNREQVGALMEMDWLFGALEQSTPAKPHGAALLAAQAPAMRDGRLS